jgi:hypothetical protein
MTSPDSPSPRSMWPRLYLAVGASLLLAIPTTYTVTRVTQEESRIEQVQADLHRVDDRINQLALVASANLKYQADGASHEHATHVPGSECECTSLSIKPSPVFMSLSEHCDAAAVAAAERILSRYTCRPSER